MSEFMERFSSLGDMIYGILVEIGLTVAVMAVAFGLSWLIVRWPA